MEYGDAFVAGTGMPCSRAQSISSGRVFKSHSRTGARIFMEGSSMRMLDSKRTWSLPLPVHPCAIATAPYLCAPSTRCLEMSGRESAETSGYLFSYKALAARAFARYSSANCCAHVHHLAGDGAGSEGLLPDGLKADVLLPHVPHDGDDVHVVLLLQPFDAAGGVKSAGICEDDSFFGHGSSLSRCAGQAGMWLCSALRSGGRRALWHVCLMWVEMSLGAGRGALTRFSKEDGASCPR